MLLVIKETICFCLTNPCLGCFFSTYLLTGRRMHSYLHPAEPHRAFPTPAQELPRWKAQLGEAALPWQQRRCHCHCQGTRGFTHRGFLSISRAEAADSRGVNFTAVTFTGSLTDCLQLASPTSAVLACPNPLRFWL